MKFIVSIIAVILFGCACIYLAGYTASEEFSGELSEIFRDTPQTVWRLMTNIENYHYLKRDVRDVRIIKNDFGYVTWREELDNGGYRTYRISQQLYLEYFAVELIDSSVKKTGTFVYKLTQTPGRTVLTIAEDSKTKSAWQRGLDFIRGKDYGLRNEMKWVRVASFGRLLNAP